MQPRVVKSKVDAKRAGVQVRAYLASLPPDARRQLKKLRDGHSLRGARRRGSLQLRDSRLQARRTAARVVRRLETSHQPLPDDRGDQRAHAADLEGYEVSKGTVRFPLTKPPPLALVRRLVQSAYR